jgi:hypothetical protein
MLLKPIDEIVRQYPWPPLSHELEFRRLLSFISEDIAFTDQRQVAYVLATVRWETRYTYKPIAENGNGAGRPYGIPDPETGQVYYGRGYCQITWKSNYERFSKVVGYDLVAQPDLALEPSVAYRILSVGMREGLFTGKKLDDYINDAGANYVDARRIINDQDHAQTIAGFAERFYMILQ